VSARDDTGLSLVNLSTFFFLLDTVWRSLGPHPQAPTMYFKAWMFQEFFFSSSHSLVFLYPGAVRKMLPVTQAFEKS
jgi:hypothetical protein